MNKKVKNTLIAMSALFALTSCYEDYVRDYDYTAAYIAYQYDLRTFVCGEDVLLGFTTALGGTINNDKDREVFYTFDNQLLTSDLSVFDPTGNTASFYAMDGFKGQAPLGALSQEYVTKEIAAAGITKLTPLPSNYYTTTGDGTIKKGRHTGNIYLHPTEEMFKDQKMLKPYYALGFCVTDADVDELIKEKSFQIMAVKVENRFYGNWYHGGRTRVTMDANGTVISDDIYSLTLPQSDNRIYVLTTEDFNSVTTNKFADKEGKLKLTFNEDNTVTVEDPSKTYEIEPINGLPSHHNGAKLIQDREIYLNYRYSDGRGKTTTVTDTLVFRNRIRDGINEWQDENTINY